MFVIVMLASPVFAQESVLLNMNQTHTMQWDWQQEGTGPVRQFVFQCQQYRKDLEADARSLRFGNFVDAPGRYRGCTLSAKNEAGLSAPVIVPDFDYAYSYGALWRIILEWAALAGASLAILATYGRPAVQFMARIIRRRPAPLALPEPIIILEKERERVYRYH